MAEEQRRHFFFSSRQVSAVANTFYKFFSFIIIIIYLKNIYTEYITHVVHPGFSSYTVDNQTDKPYTYKTTTTKLRILFF